MKSKALSLLLLITFCVTNIYASQDLFTLSGFVVDNDTDDPLPYSTALLHNTQKWVITDDKGFFQIKDVKPGTYTLEIILPFYQKAELPLTITGDTDLGIIRLRETNLALNEVVVVSKQSSKENTTSYVLDRNTLDHAQVLNLNDITALLPGSQTINSTLTNDSRIALRAGAGEQGNASFGTAIEVDGVRLDNNANMDETLAASTRNISSSNIGSVEVITGIPGAEYGDVSNGIVKVTPRRGYSRWIFEASVNPHTMQFALNKGFALRQNGGIVNIAAEFARSNSKIASPYTSYKRTGLFASYSKNCVLSFSTLNIYAGLGADFGGYSSKADPDAFQDTYTKARDNRIRANVRLDWAANTSDFGTYKIGLHSSVLYSDQFTETNTNRSSSSAQAYLHTMSQGYNIAQEYDGNLGVGYIIMGPTGYWYIKSFNDQKPLSVQMKLKGEWIKQWSSTSNNLTVGGDWHLSRNNGQGVYYHDLMYAPTWRPYCYQSLPSLNTIAFFIEDRFVWDRFTLAAGLRNDITKIRKSEYGTVTTLSPRINALYTLIDMDAIGLKLRAGYGKGYKLPSFQVLYPADTYTDKLVFTPGSTADNKAFYAYYTNVSKAVYNQGLKWQATHQTDIGTEFRFKDIKLSVSGYYNRTVNPYQQINIYTPFSYNYTSQQALENCGIPSDQRHYSIDNETGIVTVSSTTDASSITLPASKRYTYIYNRKYVNGSAVSRYGLEWILEIPILKNATPFGLELRFDGNFYHYKGISDLLVAGTPSGIGDYAEDSGIKPLIGYYAGSNITSASSVATPSVCNGSLSKGAAVNTTLTVRIPRARLIMTVRLESTFLNYKRNLAASKNAVLLAAAGDVFGDDFNGQTDSYVAMYPEYYSTWDNPSQYLPFAENLEWSSENDPSLFNQLKALIVRSNTSYYFNPQKISAYFSANFSITKEIGDHVSLSFYANNFFNNMSFVRNTQTGLDESLFGSGYIPKFYYGLSLRVKI